MTTSNAIREQISKQVPGEAFTPSSFAALGSRAAIDMALMRLVREGIIERLGRGLYCMPKTGRFGIKATPSAEQIARAVAKEEGAITSINGAEAARRFGFTTQMPTQSLFYTTGSNRKIGYGKSTIWLKHVASRKLMLGERPAGHALTALWYLGKNEVSPNTFKRLSEKLSREEFHVLHKIKNSMPSWMAEAMNKFERQTYAA